MIKNRNETSAAMDKALKNLEQAKARYEAERKKENEKRRKAQNHHKYLMGGIVAKYFPECYQYEEKELNVILSAALASAECRQAVENVKRMEKNADETTLRMVLCALRGHLRWALPALHQSRGEITFPLRPLRFLPLCILCICP